MACCTYRHPGTADNVGIHHLGPLVEAYTICGACQKLMHNLLNEHESASNHQASLHRLHIVL
jgi:hypothetical protein